MKYPVEPYGCYGGYYKKSKNDFNPATIPGIVIGFLIGILFRGLFEAGKFFVRLISKIGSSFFSGVKESLKN